MSDDDGTTLETPPETPPETPDARRVDASRIYAARMREIAEELDRMLRSTAVDVAQRVLREEQDAFLRNTPPITRLFGGGLEGAREHLGRVVRATWVLYCCQIGDDKPSHIAPWEELSEVDREADRRIGEQLMMLLVRHQMGGDA